jgi:pseudouridylate synthase
MVNSLPSIYKLSHEIFNIGGLSQGILALESAVITHGLPRPFNWEVAVELENITRTIGATPATIALINGIIHIGLSADELKELSEINNPVKISRRDFSSTIFHKRTGGTTVAGTMFAAFSAGIQVFATGGIGGVHDIESMDISADLQSLADTPMIVVCSGGKSILNLPATLEYLETMSVPVVGFQTDEFPSFYSRNSGLPVSIRLETSKEIIDFAQVHWNLGMKSSILVCQPVPPEFEIPRKEMEKAMVNSKREAKIQGIHGQALTPFLLSRISELTSGKSLSANRALLFNNAKLGAEIAKGLTI